MLTIDRDAAARFGIAPADIDAAIYNLLGQREVAQYFTQLNAYHVVIEAPPQMQTDRLDPVQLGLSALAADRKDRAAVAVRQGRPQRHQQPDRSATRASSRPTTLSFNLAPGVSLGQATEAVQKARDELGAPRQHQRLVPGHGPGLPAVAVAASRS